MTSNITWRKASYSGGEGGNCIEVATDSPTVAVRDSKDKQGATLRFTATEWQAFAAKIKSLSSAVVRPASVVQMPGAFALWSGPLDRNEY